MTTPEPGSGLRLLSSRVAGAFRIAFGLVGLIALVVGVLILIWPVKAAAILTAIIALYAIATGIIYLATAIWSGTAQPLARIAMAIVGVLFLVAGALAFANLTPAAGLLAVVVAVLIGVGWIVEGVVALLLLPTAPARWSTALVALVGIVAGIVVVSSPAWSAAVLWWLFGVLLVALGVVQIVRGFTFGRAVEEDRQPFELSFEEDADASE